MRKLVASSVIKTLQKFRCRKRAQMSDDVYPITTLLAHPHRNKKVPDDGRCKLFCAVGSQDTFFHQILPPEGDLATKLYRESTNVNKQST